MENRNKIQQNIINQNNYYIIADISATHSTFALIEKIQIQNKSSKTKNILQKKYKTNSFKSFEELLNTFLENIEKTFQITPKNAIFAVAGKIENTKDNTKVNMTNTQFTINKNKIKTHTPLQNIEIMNDFTAIAYGIETLKKSQIKTINNRKPKSQKPILIIGAGTDLGVSHLIYNKAIKQYEPQESEAGNSDFPIQTKEELELCEFIKKKNKTNSVQIGNILSGKGIENIYEFLSTKQLKAEEISQIKDKYSKQTFTMFYKFYARIAKDLALDSLSEGGIYLAGGIITKNLNFSKKDFMEEFTKNEKFSKYLKEIPIYAIKDYNISIQGLENYVLK